MPLLALALAGALLTIPHRTGADPNNANCRPNRANCRNNHDCCSGACTAGLCAAPATTSSTTTTSTTTSTTTTTLACGNGMIDAGEQCDGTNLGGASCKSLGYNTDGTLACTASCTFDTSGCQCQAFPVTGQTMCWDSSGTAISCSRTGQDGDVRAGASLSYTDNGDGTITDNNTGLMWEKKDDNNAGGVHDKDTSYTWANALGTFIPQLNNRCKNDETVDCTTNGDTDCTTGTGDACGFAGHRDWRLANVKELQSIVNYQNFNPAVSSEFNTGCVPTCTVLTCSCTASAASDYWSSTTLADSPNDAWGVLFFNGGVNFGNKGGDNLFVRAVRGGSFSCNGGAVPGGSYSDSCAACSVSACVLSCRCADADTNPRNCPDRCNPTSLDLTGCDLNQDIGNQNGVLTCVPR